MEELENLLLTYTMDRTRASREKAAMAVYNFITTHTTGDHTECWLLLTLSEASRRLHEAARDVLEEVDQLYC
jgi:hypothetical protein